jgi:hypothetical protein
MTSLARLFRRLVRVAVVLIGLILIGLAVLHLAPVRARVLDQVRGYAARELGVTLQASSCAIYRWRLLPAVLLSSWLIAW